jgi:hypothetical protein
VETENLNSEIINRRTDLKINLSTGMHNIALHSGCKLPLGF